MKFLTTSLFLVITTLVFGEKPEEITFWGVYTPQIENFEIDPDSTLAHIETYSFENIDKENEVKSVFVSAMQTDGAQDRWEKMKGIEFGDLVRILVSRTYKGKSLPLEIENGIMYVFSEEFKILETKTGEQGVSRNSEKLRVSSSSN
jgi:hypothetical protein